ncbi:hypothetical protein THII_2557 [Thioploca ingrica]|uniref:GmrSD restriction endonucleases N-terminal domain-containing protein n=1 Tax=Thioploca ingrica TaxID=40754 RepID=A0A090AHS5_9GAMM|nr:hypothetical protein THII_2557 [Thioploca ingrica]
MVDLLNNIIELDNEIAKARNNLSTDRLDMSFGEIVSMYEREELIIDPNFQRLFRWGDDQQTKFIESLVLGIPVPPLFVAEIKEGTEAGKWELIDGLQRVSTVLSFFGVLRSLPDKNNWALGEGGLVKQWRDYRFTDLALKYQLNIRRAVCRIEIIKWSSGVDMRYELFTRLNTLGTPLSDQELRNCIFRPKSNKFNDLLRKLANQEKFIELIEPTEGQQEQLYLEELVLRFFALYDAAKNVEGSDEKIKENISSYMSSYMKMITENDSFDYELESLFTRIIDLLVPLGRDVFRGGKEIARGPFSPSSYDIVMVGIALNIDNYEKMSADKIKNKLEIAKRDERSKKLVNSRQRVAQRIEFIRNIFGTQ